MEDRSIKLQATYNNSFSLSAGQIVQAYITSADFTFLARVATYNAATAIVILSVSLVDHVETVQDTNTIR